ncbi:GNAT family N-acetyltransferase [Phormidium tenue FACHB-886]|nr:GNAT family N-acetyltransferase [Phormidium tenue FACHB-886]
MLSQPTLETDRLILRPLNPSDAPSIQEKVSVRAITDTTISIPHPYPDGEAERYITRQLDAAEAGYSVTFGLECKSLEGICGILEIREIEQEHAQAELSFWVAAELWGQGYMSEALKPVIAFGFKYLSLNRLYAYHMLRNPGSGKVLQKNGFVQEGVLRQRVRKWGVFEDVALWAILQQDWLEIGR